MRSGRSELLAIAYYRALRTLSSFPRHSHTKPATGKPRWVMRIFIERIELAGNCARMDAIFGKLTPRLLASVLPDLPLSKH